MSIEISSLEKLKDRIFCGSPSWAIWGENVKNIPNEEFILDKAKPQYIFLGLNPSTQETGKKPGETLWQSFHLTSNDNKLKAALENTPFEGVYLTDLLKTEWESDSRKIKSWLNNPENACKLEENLKLLQKEIEILKESTETPITIISMHSTVTELLSDINNYKISQKLKEYFSAFSTEKGTLKNIPNYADRFHDGNANINAYRQNVHKQLGIIPL